MMVQIVIWEPGDYAHHRIMKYLYDYCILSLDFRNMVGEVVSMGAKV